MNNGLKLWPLNLPVALAGCIAAGSAFVPMTDIRANGITEVIEHIRSPTFRVIDDPALLKAAVEAKRCDKG